MLFQKQAATADQMRSQSLGQGKVVGTAGNVRRVGRGIVIAV